MNKNISEICWKVWLRQHDAAKIGGRVRPPKANSLVDGGFSVRLEPEAR